MRQSKRRDYEKKSDASPHLTSDTLMDVLNGPVTRLQWPHKRARDGAIRLQPFLERSDVVGMVNTKVKDGGKRDTRGLVHRLNRIKTVLCGDNGVEESIQNSSDGDRKLGDALQILCGTRSDRGKLACHSLPCHEITSPMTQATSANWGTKGLPPDRAPCSMTRL